jgi:hypothetical protein
VGYSLGIDFGTSSVTAAVVDDGGVASVTFDGGADAVPAEVYLAEDGALLTGQAAHERYAEGDPSRGNRELKRLLADPNPVLLGDQGYVVTALIGTLLHDVITRIIEARGGEAPDRVALSYPAGWGPFRVARFEEASKYAGLLRPTMVPEPVAVAARLAGRPSPPAPPPGSPGAASAPSSDPSSGEGRAAVEPGAVEPGVVEPGVAEPGVAEPGAGESGAGEQAGAGAADAGSEPAGPPTGQPAAPASGPSGSAPAPPGAGQTPLTVRSANGAASGPSRDLTAGSSDAASPGPANGRAPGSANGSSAAVRTVAVYDLGGGSLDVAVVRATADRAELVGTPEGVERLGGVEFDTALMRYVDERVVARGADDRDARVLLDRLRRACADAVRALSEVDEVTVAVPGGTAVRVSRTDFEHLVRPYIEYSLGVLSRALDSAELRPADLDEVRLVGGSARLPMVARMIAQHLGRPVRVDPTPTHAVALGTAVLAFRAPMPLTASVLAARYPPARADEQPVTRRDTAAAAVPEQRRESDTGGAAVGDEGGPHAVVAGGAAAGLAAAAVASTAHRARSGGPADRPPSVDRPGGGLDGGDHPAEGAVAAGAPGTGPAARTGTDSPTRGPDGGGPDGGGRSTGDESGGGPGGPPSPAGGAGTGEAAAGSAEARRRQRRHRRVLAASVVAVLVLAVVILLVLHPWSPRAGTAEQAGGGAAGRSLALSTSRVAIGEQYYATATGFTPGERITFAWTGPTTGVMGTFPTDGTGAYRQGPILERDPPGHYRITATGESPGSTVAVDLDVLPAR